MLKRKPSLAYRKGIRMRLAIQRENQFSFHFLCVKMELPLIIPNFALCFTPHLEIGMDMAPFPAQRLEKNAEHQISGSTV